MQLREAEAAPAQAAARGAGVTLTGWAPPDDDEQYDPEDQPVPHDDEGA